MKCVATVARSAFGYSVRLGSFSAGGKKKLCCGGQFWRNIALVAAFAAGSLNYFSLKSLGLKTARLTRHTYNF